MGAMIALSQLSIAQAAGTVVTTPTVSGNTVLLGAGPTTPIVTYAAPPPTACIINAGPDGISNTAPLPSTLPSNHTVVYYSQHALQPMVALPGAVASTTGEATATAAPEAAPAENTGEGISTSGESVGKVFDDYGPSYFAGTSTGGNAAPNANRASLAEIAAQHKAARAGLNARTLSNQDVDQMLGSKPGVTMAKNMPPLGPGPMPTGAAPSAAPANPPQSGTESAQAPQSGTGKQPTTPPPAQATQAPPAGSTTATTTPQINPNQQSNDAQGKSKLPSTASFLPLLGLLGLVSGGIGLLVRRFRR